MNDVRSLYMVLSPASLPYARHAIESLMERSVEQVHLHLITDSDADREKLEAFMRTVEHRKRHHWNVYSGTDLAQTGGRTIRRFSEPAGLPEGTSLLAKDHRPAASCRRRV